MKKVSMLVIAGLAISFASCKKSYTCECCTTYAGSSACGSATSGKMKKKDAEAWCNTGNDSYTSGGYTYTTECKLK